MRCQESTILLYDLHHAPIAVTVFFQFPEYDMVYCARAGACAEVMCPDSMSITSDTPESMYLVNK